ncbi:MAG: peptidoglycan-binding protein, partial [Oceanospirillaceae bacterium]|nr:peptidoglycan-binding protein [Oceanospirillaceae bacterium]
MKLRVTHFAMLLFIASFAYIGPAYSLTISTFNVSPYDGRKNNKSYTGAWLNIKESRDDNGSIGPFRWGFEFGSDYRKPRSFNIGFSSSRTFLKGGESVRIYDKRNDGDLGNRFWITLSSTYDSTNPKVIDRVSKFYKGLSPANQKVFESTCEILSNSALVSETLDRLSRAVGQSSEYKAFWGQASRKSQLLAAGSLCSAAVAKGGTILKLSRSYIDTYVSKKRYYSNGGVEQLKVAVVTKPAKSAKVVSNQPSVANLCDSLSSIDGEIQPGGTWVEFLLSGSGMQRETLMINLTRSVDSVYKPVNGLPKKLEIRNTRLDNSKGYTRFVAGKLKFYPAGGNDPCELQYVATKDTYKLFKSSDGSDQIVTKAVEEKPDKIKLVFAGLTAQERETVQRGLKDLGFYASNIDGLYGPGTKGAIESYLDLTDPQGVDESLIAGQLRKLISVTEQKIAASRKSVGLVTTGKTEATVADKTERDDERVTEPFEINDEFLLSDVEKFVVGKPEALDAFKLASLYLPAQREVASGTLSSKFQDLKSFVLSNENFVAYAKEQERLREIKYREEIDRNLSFVTTEVEKLRAEIAKAPLSERALQLYSVVEKYSSVTDSSGGEAIISAASALRKDIEGLENNTQ